MMRKLVNEVAYAGPARLSGEGQNPISPDWFRL